MRRNNSFKFLTATTIAAGTLLVATSDGLADVVNGYFQDDARGDVVRDHLLTRELGDAAMFPASEALVYHDHRSHFTVGVPDDGVANDWLVHIKNVSGQSFKTLYFVADHGATIGNADGRVEDMTGAPGVFTDAFRIDAQGVNANLMMESITADGMLEPNEEWEFVVTNFNTGVNSRPPEIITPGAFAGSSQLGPTGNNGSILAVPVPEPTTLGVLGIVTIALLTRRPHRTCLR